MLIEQRGMLCRTGQESCVFDKRARYFLAVRMRASSRNRTKHLPHTKAGVAPCNSRGRNRQTQPYGWSTYVYAKKSKCDGTAHLRGIKKRKTNPAEAGRSPKGKGRSRMRAMRRVSLLATKGSMQTESKQVDDVHGVCFINDLTL